jgi:hypothetical protein
MLESLESRRMLSASISASLSGSTLTVTTGADGSFANVVEDHGTVLVENVTAGTSTTFTGVTKIYINGQAKTDNLYYTGNSIGAVIDANGGNDNIVIADIGTGSSYATGNGGDDVITVIVGHRSTLVGGGGNDLIYLNTDTSGAYDTVNAENFVYGDGGGDTFTAYNGINHIYGGGGDDTLIDLGGTNTVNSVENVVTL